MSLGKRLLLRGNTNAVASISTPREPLHFLYPAFLHPHLRRSSSAAPAASSVSTPSEKVLESSTRRKDDEDSILLDTCSHERTSSIARQVVAKPIKRNKPPRLSRSLAQILHLTHKAKDLGANVAHDDLAVLLDDFDDYTRERRPIVRQLIAKSIAKKEQHHKVRSLAKWSHHAGRAEERSIIFEPDWRKILSFLNTYTTARSQKWHDDALVLRIPESAAYRLLFDLDSNIWEIGRKTGAHIEIKAAKPGKRQEAKGSYRMVSFSGPVTSIAKASAEVMRVTGSTRGAAGDEISKYGIGTKSVAWSKNKSEQSTNMSSLSDSSSTPSLQRVSSASTRNANLSLDTWQTSHKAGDVHSRDSVDLVRLVRAEEYRDMLKPCSVDEVPLPEDWTQASFSRYVKHLTTTRMSRAVHTQSHESSTTKRPSHTEQVLSRLKEIFNDTKVRVAGAITITSLNDALMYCNRYSAVHLAQEIYTMAEKQHLRMQPETFEIMLTGASKARNFYAFQHVLSLMVKQRCELTPYVWLQFLFMVDDVVIKQTILQSMVEKRLLHDPRVRQLICTQFVKPELAWSLEKKASHDEFIAHMRERYGDIWFSQEAANAAMDGLAQRGLMSRCWDLFQYMHQNDLKPDDVTTSSIISNCCRHGNMGGGIEVLSRAAELFDLSFKAATYDKLNHWALKTKSYNLAAVVWRYACLEGRTTYRMEVELERSLNKAFKHVNINETTGRLVMSSSSENSMTSGEYFKTVIGLFVLSRHQLDQNETLDKNVLQGFSAPTTISRRKDIIQAVKMQNIRLRNSWEPTQPFIEAMATAYYRDLAWKATMFSDMPLAQRLLGPRQGALVSTAKGSVLPSDPIAEKPTVKKRTTQDFTNELKTSDNQASNASTRNMKAGAVQESGTADADTAPVGDTGAGVAGLNSDKFSDAKSLRPDTDLRSDTTVTTRRLSLGFLLDNPFSVSVRKRRPSGASNAYLDTDYRTV